MGEQYLNWVVWLNIAWFGSVKLKKSQIREKTGAKCLDKLSEGENIQDWHRKVVGAKS